MSLPPVIADHSELRLLERTRAPDVGEFGRYFAPLRPTGRLAYGKPVVVSQFVPIWRSPVPAPPPQTSALPAPAVVPLVSPSILSLPESPDSVSLPALPLMRSLPSPPDTV